MSTVAIVYHFPQLAYKSVADNVLHSDHIWKVIIFPFIPIFLLPSWWSTRGLNSLGFLLVLLNLLVGRCGRRNSTPVVLLVPLVLMVAVLLVLIVVVKNMGQRSLQKCVVWVEGLQEWASREEFWGEEETRGNLGNTEKKIQLWHGCPATNSLRNIQKVHLINCSLVVITKHWNFGSLTLL